MSKTHCAAAASRLTVCGLFRQQAVHRPGRIALSQQGETWTYAETDDRVRRLARALIDRGLKRGDRIALLTENRREYAEIELAAASIGVIVACQNWRLAADELKHCVTLVDPALAIVSARHHETYADLQLAVPCLVIERDYEGLLAADPLETLPEVDPEDGMVILYTSGTTGLPKGALISHRAEIARMTVLRMDLRVTEDDGFVAWAPMFHMGSTDQALAALMSGATVHMVDGFDAEAIVTLIETESLGWLLLMPGSIEPVVELMKTTGRKAKSVRAVGAMIDLVPRALAAELSRLTGAPYLNSFGSTETGLPPASSALIPPAAMPETLSKSPSSMIEIRLVDPDGGDAPDGSPGEVAVRGPTLFSGYWAAEETNARDFRGGWFHMGDMFSRTADGRYDFVDRVKYMIKSGGENIYPAEIERVLLADPRVSDAVIVRKQDPVWGEVPVAFIARKSPDLTAAHVEEICRAALAGYKRPKEVHFLAFEDFPRSTTGKILRHEVERRLTG